MKIIPIDLHCHSNHSDGVYSIPSLLDIAISNNSRYLAITDHDTVNGIIEAKKYVKNTELKIISGVEISVTWEDNTLIHILGLNIDETNTELINNLNQLRNKRLERGILIADKLDKINIKNSLKEALTYCTNPNSLSRNHFAKFLINKGYVKNKAQAFIKYLNSGMPAYVQQRWTTLENAVNWIKSSGGLSVIAHPGRYKISRDKLLHLIKQFKYYGGDAIEIISSSHSKYDIENFAKIAHQENLLTSAGSDFHGDIQYEKQYFGIIYNYDYKISIYKSLNIHYNFK